MLGVHRLEVFCQIGVLGLEAGQLGVQEGVLGVEEAVLGQEVGDAGGLCLEEGGGERVFGLLGGLE